VTGWLITGVRGEGKSLAAVNKIREYGLQGRIVATNLDIYTDGLFPDDSMALVYRLPDKPDIKDLEALPVPYDINYKAEDHNGLLVLDEVGTWGNSRSWNDKSRLAVLSWLFLSRKLHWDIILLAQDVDTIDFQMRKTLCEYWVQSSRSDRNVIPFLGMILKSLGFNYHMPLSFNYLIFYGFESTKPQDKWSYDDSCYTGYNTNQLFKDNLEIDLKGNTVKSQHLYTFIPAAYLTGHYYHVRAKQQFDTLTKLTDSIFSGDDMRAAKKQFDTNKAKMYLIAFAVVLFLGYRYMSGGMSFPKTQPVAQQQTQPTSPLTQLQLQPNQPVAQQQTQSNQSPVQQQIQPSQPVAQQTNNFIDNLLQTTQPRLSWVLLGESGKYDAGVNFVDGDGNTLEYMTVKDLHALGVTLLRKPYGFDLLYRSQVYILPWLNKQLDKSEKSKDSSKSKTVTTADKSTKPKCNIKPTMTDDEIKACQG
jgi:hypothetical protein